LAEIFEKPPDVGGHYEPLGKAELVDHNDHCICLRAGSATIEITALSPDLFRVGMFPKPSQP
jgi:alpha-glucosidase